MKHILRCHEIVKTDFVRGEGCYLYDAHDQRYLDFEAGIWCTALGHNHWRINQVMQSQMQKIIHLGTRYPNVLAEEAATKVLDVTTLPNSKCTFLSSGSEAVEFGVQITRRMTERPLLLTFSDSYLAAYGSAGKKNPDEWYCLDWQACATCAHADECDPQCRHLQEIPFEQIGGLVFEPGNAHGRVQLPPKQLVQTLVSLVRQQHGLVVVNEITTGMGRTGAWFGFQHYDLQPDVVAVGKGLGNGYPVSAVAMTGVIADRLENSAFRYVQSHQNDALGCAIAREVITIFQEDGLVERSKRLGTYFLDELKKLGERHHLIKEVRGRGLMIVLEIEGNDEPFSVTSIYHALLTRGFLVGCTPTANLLRFYPALVMDQEDIAQLLENLDQILEDLQ
jgi:acetylornithine/N-succinyldiaminopimelate aminotransferase